MQKVKSPPVNLDQYLEGGPKRYLTYEDAARLYSMPYWTFVNLAIEQMKIIAGLNDAFK